MDAGRGVFGTSGAKRASLSVFRYVMVLVAIVLLCSGEASSQASTPSGNPVSAGQAAYDRGEYAQAISLWQSVLPALQQANDPRTADVLSRTGLAFYFLQDFQKSLDALHAALAINRARKDRQGEATDLADIGLVENLLGHHADALALYKQALVIERALEDRAGQAVDLVNIGKVEIDLERYNDAVAPLQEALALDHALGNGAGEAIDRHNLGIAEEHLRRYEDALASYQQALAIRRALANRLGEAEELGSIGSVDVELERYNDAQTALRQAVAIDAELGNRSGQAAALENLALVEQHLGRFDDALASHRQALALDRALKDRQAEADDLGNMSVTEKELGHYAEALATYRQALAIHRELKDRLGEAHDLGNIANLQNDLGHYDDALASYRNAMLAFHDLDDPVDEAGTFNNIGEVELALGRYDAALHSFQQALAGARALKNQLTESNALALIGDLAEKLGRYDEASTAYQQALAIDRALNDAFGQASVLREIGNLDVDLGRSEDGLASFQAALAIDRALESPRAEAGDLGNIGDAQEQLGHFDEALASHRQALAIDRALELRPLEAAELGDIGNVEDALKRYDDALNFARQSLSIARELKDRPGEANELSNIGHEDEELGRYGDALVAERAAIAIETQLASADSWRSFRTKAIADAHLGHRDEALAAFDAALDQIEQLRANLKPSERTSFLGTTLFVYDEYIAYLDELNGTFPGRGYERKAFEILERKSARATLEQIGQSAAEHFKGVPAAIVAGENAAEAGVDDARALLAKLRSSEGGYPAAIAAAQRNLADAQARAAALASRIRSDYPDYYRLRHPQPLLVECGPSPCLTISRFQQSVLRPGELMLVYDVLHGKSVLWLVDSDRIALVSIAGSDEIDAAVARLSSHVSGLLRLLEPGVRARERLQSAAAADIPAYAADSYALYHMLVPEAAASAIAGAKSVIVVPSGSLYRLAFESLVTRDPTNAPRPHYLIEDAPVSYMPSASLLAIVRSSYAQPSAGRQPLLAFANPAFGAAASGAVPAGATASGSGRSSPSYAQLQLAAVRSAARSSTRFAVGDAVFPALPGTQTEAEAVRAALNAPRDSLIVGDLATRRRVLDLNQNNQLRAYRYVLFATHAVLPSEIAGLTQPAIVLAHPERGDGLLTMADVFGLSLDADFVTLSACDTGVLTADSAGEGVSGFTRAFLYAGTPAISVTLWEVDDAAAPQITPRFFAGMHAGTLTPAESLRRAKLALLDAPDARFRHPYAWAPGVIFGDGDRPGAPGP